MLVFKAFLLSLVDMEASGSEIVLGLLSSSSVEGVLTDGGSASVLLRPFEARLKHVCFLEVLQPKQN